MALLHTLQRRVYRGSPFSSTRDANNHDQSLPSIVTIRRRVGGGGTFWPCTQRIPGSGSSTCHQM